MESGTKGGKRLALLRKILLIGQIEPIQKQEHTSLQCQGFVINQCILSKLCIVGNVECRPESVSLSPGTQEVKLYSVQGGVSE